MGEPMALRLHDGNDRDELFLCLLRIKFWTLILLWKGLDKALHKSYNTTPAEEGTRSGSLLFAAWVADHMFISSLSKVDHMLQLECSSLLYLFSLSVLLYFFSTGGVIFKRIYRLKTRPHINHSALGFDHIFDHKQNRSTRRQECTRVWKSRFCVAERARKSKNG